MPATVPMRALLAILLAMACGSALGAKYEFDLDVPGGHFSYFKIGDVPASGSVSGSIKFLELRADTKWSPLFAVNLEGADGRTLTLQFIALDKGRTLMTKIMSGDGEPVVAVHKVEKNAELPVAITWTQGGECTLRMPDGASKSIACAPPIKIKLSASSADVAGSNWAVTAAQP